MSLGEFDLIKTYFAPLTSGVKGAFDLGDDAAIIDPPPGKSIVITNDSIVEGVHFFSSDTPENIAGKLLRVNLSDLAAMGSVPSFYNLSVSMNALVSEDWIREFTSSLHLNQIEFGVSLIGGDTVSVSGPLTLSLTAFGFIDTGRLVRRSGALVGDDIWISGTIGDAAFGLLGAQNKLSDISEEHVEFLISRYNKPNPRVQLAPVLIESANSAIDVSDGLLADLNHICTESRVGAKIFVSKIPTSEAVDTLIDNNPKYMDLILSGGDDYELLFTAKVSERETFELAQKKLKIPLARIGSIVREKSLSLFDGNGVIVPIKKFGYTHF